MGGGASCPSGTDRQAETARPAIGRKKKKQEAPI